MNAELEAQKAGDLTTLKEAAKLNHQSVSEFLLHNGLAAAALVLAWNTQQRVRTLEAELVKRQQDSGSQATEARTLSRQA